MDFLSYKYFPLLKTRQAELKALNNTGARAFQRTLPIIELTASRKSKKNAQGDILKNLEFIEEETDFDKFILDLTLETDFQNSQIEKLLSPRNAFSNWTSFAKEHQELGLIPVVHIYEGMAQQDIQRQAESLRVNFGQLAVRLPYSANGISNYLAAIYPTLAKSDDLLIILDAGFIPTGRATDHDEIFVQTVSNIEKNQPGKLAISTLSSSFPSSVKDKGYGGDKGGEFRLEEKEFTNLVNKHKLRNRIKHGDYATIHPYRYPDMFGGWVPRIDVPQKFTCFYHRRRRENGGYVEAAKQVMADSRYKKYGFWGNRQIALAAKNQPEGRSPSHWISVRINLHLEMMNRFWK